MDTVKETIMNNMAVAVGLLIAVILCLIYFFWQRRENARSGKKGASPDESEMDELIEKIHSKQKKSASVKK
jgi:heme/copper-type cytochrome/quinol oxidase subunit 2